MPKYNQVTTNSHQTQVLPIYTGASGEKQWGHWPERGGP